jgi:probable regulatory domain-containing protein
MVEVPLNPVGREEIHRLESVLLFATLFRPEVIELIKDPAERLTWVDSLAVAAGAIAREKAGMTVSEMAEELGRTEATIRKHLKGETKAGQLVRETYELIKQGKLDELVRNIEVLAEGGQVVTIEEYEKLKREKEELEEKARTLEEENHQLKAKIENIRKVLNDALERVKEIEKLL